MNSKLYFKIYPNWLDPELIFDSLFAQEPCSFWLDSSLTNEENRFSYMGASPRETYTCSVENNQTPQEMFDFLEKKLSENAITADELPFPFIGGLVGYFGYEMQTIIKSNFKQKSQNPDSLWYFVDKFIAFDHKEKKLYLVCLTEEKQEAQAWFEEIDRKIQRDCHSERNEVKSKNLIPENKSLRKDPSTPYQSLGMTKPFHLARSHQQYLKDIETCKQYLAKGESYQICLTNKLEIATEVDPLTLYKILRNDNPAPYAAYLKYYDLTILCSSPEQFLKIDKNKNVQTKPIKGTIKRGATKIADKKLQQQLQSSKKDWSENAMIVDLLRNDLGKVCAFGSVKVTKSMAIESYATVHQLVSTITGKLRPDASVIDCIKACFPGGSMTGAPKKRTMEILTELEKRPRGIYSGALGFLSFNQTAELNIIIRTIVTNKNKLSIGAGGAILMDSDPQSEYAEMLLKTKALLESIKKAVYTTHMHTVYLALGSNVGDKKQHIQQAVSTLEKHLKEIQSAKLYETKPMYHEDQDMFLNTVIKGQTLLSPQELFAFVKLAEEELGRQKRFPNGPREIDIDILFYDGLIYESVDLIIPHPRISERDFVLRPFADIEPDFMHPVLQKTVKELLAALEETL